jgi:hypothetical protein
MMTVCKEEEVFATVDGGAIGVAMLALGKGGAIGGATMGGWLESAVGGAVFSCGAGGAIRETDGGAEGAKRRVNGSRRRKGVGLEIAGATADLLGGAGTTFGCTGEKPGRGGSSLGTEITGAAKPGSSNGRWNGSRACAAILALR